MLPRARRCANQNGRKLREHLALARDRVGQDAVEGREPVGGHEQQAVAAQVEDLAHLAGTQFRDAGQIEGRKVHAGEGQGDSTLTVRTFL